ncbi:MAG: hypothetical protein ACD_56C00164G0001 [uncultured bacterium]|nr:MAG: hypothetical protein ACD_56C00164G0001 [uncultured bacterium]
MTKGKLNVTINQYAQLIQEEGVTVVRGSLSMKGEIINCTIIFNENLSCSISDFMEKYKQSN